MASRVHPPRPRPPALRWLPDGSLLAVRAARPSSAAGSCSVAPRTHRSVLRRGPCSVAAAAATPAAAAANSSQAPPALHTARSVHILWDLDNIPVAHAAHLPLVGRRLVLAVLRHAGGQQGATQQSPTSSDAATHPACQLTAYANERTLARLGGADAAGRALALVGAGLVAVPVRKNSADLAMRGHLHQLALHNRAATAAAAEGPAAAPAVGPDEGTSVVPPAIAPAPIVVACATNDHGFADALRFAAARGCEVWAVCEPLRTRRRPAWAGPPDYSRFPLPAAAGRCLVWDSGWLPTAGEQAAEAALAAEWAAGAGLPLPALPCSGGVAAAWHAAGKCSSLMQMGLL